MILGEPMIAITTNRYRGSVVCEPLLASFIWPSQAVGKVTIILCTMNDLQVMYRTHWPLREQPRGARW